MGFFSKKDVPDQMLTTNFSLREMACQCGCGHMPDIEFLRQLQALRDRFGKPMVINSGARCKRHNQAVGGSGKSYHILGRAVDVHVPDDVYRYKLIAAAIASGFNGIKVYPTYIHIDNRDAPWCGVHG